MTQKSALIVGASSGIGLAVAENLGISGSQLYLVARGSERLEEAANRTGGKAIVADLSDADSVQQIRETIQSQSGKLDQLVLSGAYEVHGSIADLSLGELNQAVATNVLGNTAVLKVMLPLLQKSDAASVVVIGSVGSERAYKNFAEHYLCKSALLGLIRSASMDFGKYNIRVNMVSPGWVLTQGTYGFIEMLCKEKSLNEKQIMKLLSAHVPLERMAEPAEVASVVEFLLSDKASYISGANVPVDGGLMNIDAGMTALMVDSH